MKLVLPEVSTPEEWRSPSAVEAVARHLIETMTLDVSLSDLEDDIVQALKESEHIVFEWAASVNSDCELFGTYVATPPRIRVARKQHTARANFTAAHELGHHLQVHDIDWAADVLADLRADKPWLAKQVEEAVSDQVASLLLLPDDFVQLHWRGSLTPGFVRALTRNGGVSRSAATIRALGFSRQHESKVVIVVSDREGIVVFAAATDGGMLAPPARGSHQPDLERIARVGEGHHRARGGIHYSSGTTRSDVKYESEWDVDGSHLITIIRPEYPFGTPNWGSDVAQCQSEACGEVFSRSEATRCELCNRHKCPSCSSCGCVRREGKTCINCFFVMSLAESERGDAHEVCP